MNTQNEELEKRIRNVASSMALSINHTMKKLQGHTAEEGFMMEIIPQGQKGNARFEISKFNGAVRCVLTLKMGNTSVQNIIILPESDVTTGVWEMQWGLK